MTSPSVTPNILKLEEFAKRATKRQLEDFLWLNDHKEYVERPVTIHEFVTSPQYLNQKKYIRPRILEEMDNIFPTAPTNGKLSEYEEIVFMCGIGWGKSFSNADILAYLIYCALCLKNPQDYYGLAPGTEIHLMLMSNSERQAHDVIFSTIKAAIDNSPWFQNPEYAYDKKTESRLIFPKNIQLIPGNSQETFFEGYNIIAGIIDEADSHKRTSEKDYVDDGYTAIKRRVVSRFQDKGLVMIIGSPKLTDGFLMNKFKEAKNNPKIYAKSVPTWDSLQGTNKLKGPTFRVEHAMLRNKDLGGGSGYIDVPIEYKGEFERNVEKALRDLAAVPFYAVSPFFTMPEKVENYSIVTEVPYDKDHIIKPTFLGDGMTNNYIHIDLALKHDACGIAMGHIADFAEFEDEVKPIIQVDLMLRIAAPPGGEIIFGDIRKILYNLQERGFVLYQVTLDGWQSAETLQHLRRKNIRAELLSVDKTTAPYEELKDALYENRFQSHDMKELIRLKDGSTRTVNIFVEECVHLELLDGKKVDHPSNGSKDVADAVAGCVYNIATSQEAKNGVVLMAPTMSGKRTFTN